MGRAQGKAKEAPGKTKAANTLILTLSLQDREKYIFAVKSHPDYGILLRQLELPATGQEHGSASSRLLGSKGRLVPCTHGAPLPLPQNQGLQ